MINQILWKFKKDKLNINYDSRITWTTSHFIAVNKLKSLSPIHAVVLYLLQVDSDPDF